MATFGEELRRERELREIDLREVSEATKVALRYLEALERNEFEDLPGGVFNRGFVRAYAQYIGVDPEDMVNAYLLEEQAQGGPTKPPQDGLLRGDRLRSTQRAEPLRSMKEERPSRRWGWWALAAVVGIGILGLALWFAGLRWDGWREAGESPPAGVEQTHE